MRLKGIELWPPCIQIATDSKKVLDGSYREGNILPPQRESVLSVTHWLQSLVSIPTETLMKNSQACDMWKSLLAVGDSWLPVNLNDFTKWRKKTATEGRYLRCNIYMA